VKDNYLESATIYERLIDQGVEVPDRALSAVLLEMAGSERRINLTPDIEPPDEAIRKHGGLTIHDARGLCP
jgi:hypothetical protein